MTRKTYYISFNSSQLVDCMKFRPSCFCRSSINKGSIVWATRMHTFSFQSPKHGPIGLTLIKSVTPILRYFIFSLYLKYPHLGMFNRHKDQILNKPRLSTCWKLNKLWIKLKQAKIISVYTQCKLFLDSNLLWLLTLHQIIIGRLMVPHLKDPKYICLELTLKRVIWLLCALLVG